MHVVGGVSLTEINSDRANDGDAAAADVTGFPFALLR